jgi:hypothetical protein
MSASIRRARAHRHAREHSGRFRLGDGLRAAGAGRAPAPIGHRGPLGRRYPRRSRSQEDLPRLPARPRRGALQHGLVRRQGAERHDLRSHRPAPRHPVSTEPGATFSGRYTPHASKGVQPYIVRVSLYPGSRPAGRDRASWSCTGPPTATFSAEPTHSRWNSRVTATPFAAATRRSPGLLSARPYPARGVPRTSRIPRASCAPA